MKRIFVPFCSVLLLLLCADDTATDLHEAYQIARTEAYQWDTLAEPYFITSVDDPVKTPNIKGENGKRNCWNFDFVVKNTRKHLIITVHNRMVVSKTEAESYVNNHNIIDIEKLGISTAEAVGIAKENNGLLPGTDWAQGYHFVLENEGSGLILSVVGLDEAGSMTRVFFDAKTGEIIRNGGVSQNMSYENIINLPHHVSAKRAPMSMLDRAAQFAPFAALTGHEDIIRETARQVDQPIELTESRREELNRQLQLLSDHIEDHPKVAITHYIPDPRKSGGAYVITTACMKKFDEYAHTLILTDGSGIDVDTVIQIELVDEW